MSTNLNVHDNIYTNERADSLPVGSLVVVDDCWPDHSSRHFYKTTRGYWTASAPSKYEGLPVLKNELDSLISRGVVARVGPAPDHGSVAEILMLERGSNALPEVIRSLLIIASNYRSIAKSFGGSDTPYPVKQAEAWLARWSPTAEYLVKEPS